MFNSQERHDVLVAFRSRWRQRLPSIPVPETHFGFGTRFQENLSSFQVAVSCRQLPARARARSLRPVRAGSRPAATRALTTSACPFLGRWQQRRAELPGLCVDVSAGLDEQPAPYPLRLCAAGSASRNPDRQFFFVVLSLENFAAIPLHLLVNDQAYLSSNYAKFVVVIKTRR
ncbi:hypothetical protein PWT90_05499 [Aphanocladium album]|nr:hypothetical protein PWT90_05499 [Aphanocladium album]